MRCAVFLCIAAVLVTAGCGSLTDEPRIVGAVPRAVDAPVADMTRPGAPLFVERCTPCHGEGGRGDGPLVRAGQIAAPPDFTQPATMTVHGVQAIFDTITAGRIEKMMPPWDGALTAEERWALAEFVAGLGAAPTEGG